jgi:AraC-like DNA-binding protein
MAGWRGSQPDAAVQVNDCAMTVNLADRRAHILARGVGVLARNWGFASPSVFCRAFRDQYGDAPQSYRRLHIRL